SIRGPATIPRSNRSSGASPDTPLSAVGQTPSDLRVYPWGPIWGSLHTISISEGMLRGVGGCTTLKGCTGTEGPHVRVNPSTGAYGPLYPLKGRQPPNGGVSPLYTLKGRQPPNGGVSPLYTLKGRQPPNGGVSPLYTLKGRQPPNGGVSPL